MKYQSQKVARAYFTVALPLFVLQVIMGLYLGFSYFATVPQSVVNVFPFATARAIHTNLLVLWLLLGFMGGAYYIIPEETESEIYSEKLAYFQLALLTATGVAAVVGFLFGWNQGRPLLEIPRPLDMLVVVGALIFLFNIGITIIKAKRWTAIQGTLLGGLLFLALLYLFGIPFYKNAAIDWYYWWWVIHLWVEGAWELVTGAIIAFILLKITGVERNVVEKWLYIEVGLFLFTGIAGTEVKNKFVLTLAVANAVYHLIGAGVWGLVHTLPQINYYTHGSQVTVSHGHLAFFGAYVLLNLTVFYYTFPKFKGIDVYNERRGKIGFWTMAVAMMGMGLTFGVAGVIQAYVERVLGFSYMTAQQHMRLWMAITFVFGIFLVAGVVTTAYDLLFMKPAKEDGPFPGAAQLGGGEAI
jgi:nitric oxide reductase subunit B